MDFKEMCENFVLERLNFYIEEKENVKKDIVNKYKNKVGNGLNLKELKIINEMFLDYKLLSNTIKRIKEFYEKDKRYMDSYEGLDEFFNINTFTITELILHDRLRNSIEDLDKYSDSFDKAIQDKLYDMHWNRFISDLLNFSIEYSEKNKLS